MRETMWDYVNPRAKTVWRVGNRDYGVSGRRLNEREKPWMVVSPDGMIGRFKYFRRFEKALAYAVRKSGQ